MNESRQLQQNQSSCHEAPAQSFDVPVVLLLFLRERAALRIIDQLRQVRPSRVYLISDEGRNAEERAVVAKLRTAVEAAIDWDCRVVRNYARENRGVYANIALGARWVFEREESAIFLEDDNVPELTFFPYCEELLDRFRTDSRVLWICGTNYMGDDAPEGGPSYYFTRHLLPCGWASWAPKFLRFYDFDLALTDVPAVMDAVAGQYEDGRLLRQQMQSLLCERRRRDRGEQYRSWDHHMAFTLRANGLLGVAPARNQILNVGADQLSTHGGSSLGQVMTRRFCGMNSFPLAFPLQHPDVVLPDPAFERRLGRIILQPLRLRIKARVRSLLGGVFRLDPDRPLATYIVWNLRRGGAYDNTPRG